MRRVNNTTDTRSSLFELESDQMTPKVNRHARKWYFFLRFGKNAKNHRLQILIYILLKTQKESKMTIHFVSNKFIQRFA